ncbi:MAG: FCD domain-containing protein [Rhodococcus sp. (in: high G+C Gram-positive bacteria)]|uniref:FadR/GntR family transcriptional regulator n=1 Tax=Rhodococcus sp. TaxID=1831 RepID=UPI003BAEA0E5
MRTDKRVQLSTVGHGAKVRAVKASEQIANRLRSQIVRGEIQPGEMLPSEKMLIAQFDVSRPTLREAFRILESEGLITVLTGARGGPQARLPDLSVAARHIGLYLQVQGTTVEDLLEARTAFEPALARFLAERCSAEGLEALEDCVDAQQASADRGFESEEDFAVWVSLVGEFHNLIALYCGNKTLAAQARALRDVLEAHRRLGIKARRPDVPIEMGFIQAVVDDCRGLVDLVRARDVDGAEQHWRKHLQHVADSILRTRDVNVTINLFD